MTEVLLDIRDLSKAFGGVHAIADLSMHGAAPHLHRHVLDGVHAPEGLGQVPDVQQRLVAGAHPILLAHQRARVGTMPCGKNTMVPISTAPKTIIS